MKDASEEKAPLAAAPAAAPAQQELEAAKLVFERRKQELETVKLLHSAALERWKDRRENEWKLNYAIWAGIAAFDGVLLLHKDAIKLTWWAAVIIGILGLLFHLGYLWPTIERAINEIELQNKAEHAIHSLIEDAAVREMIPPRYLGGAIQRFDERGKFREWLWKRYGLFAPLAFTGGLLAIAMYLMQR